jgi:myosin-5
MAHIYDIGTRAWQPDVTEGWVASEVTDKQIAGDKVRLVFKLENGEVCTTTAAGKGHRDPD